MKRIGLHVTFVLALTGLLFWTVWPPKDTLRLGKDLRGGVSLIYSVKLPPDANSEQTLKQVIEVLKQRVNPTGVLDISFAPQGRDRIEVVMPLPSPEVQALQASFRQALAALVARTRIDATELEQSLQAGKAQERFGGSDERFKVAWLRCSRLGTRRSRPGGLWTPVERQGSRWTPWRTRWLERRWTWRRHARDWRDGVCPRAA